MNDQSTKSKPQTKIDASDTVLSRGPRIRRTETWTLSSYMEDADRKVKGQKDEGFDKNETWTLSSYMEDVEKKVIGPNLRDNEEATNMNETWSLSTYLENYDRTLNSQSLKHNGDSKSPRLSSPQHQQWKSQSQSANSKAGNDEQNCLESDTSIDLLEQSNQSFQPPSPKQCQSGYINNVKEGIDGHASTNLLVSNNQSCQPPSPQQYQGANPHDTDLKEVIESSASTDLLVPSNPSFQSTSPQQCQATNPPVNNVKEGTGSAASTDLLVPTTQSLQSPFSQLRPQLQCQLTKSPAADISLNYLSRYTVDLPNLDNTDIESYTSINKPSFQSPQPLSQSQTTVNVADPNTQADFNNELEMRQANMESTSMMKNPSTFQFQSSQSFAPSQSSVPSQSQNRRRQLGRKQQFVQCKEGFRKGLWVQCNQCEKWRYLKGTCDVNQLPTIWNCHMNPDPKYQDCQTPQDPEYDDFQYVPSDFAVGTIKWVKIESFPRWPAIIDDNPDTLTSIWHSDPDENGLISTKVHVVFFDSLNGTVTRSWVNIENTQPFKENETLKKAGYSSVSDPDFNENFKLAFNAAKKASKLSLSARQSMYCVLHKTKKNNKLRWHIYFLLSLLSIFH